MSRTLAAVFVGGAVGSLARALVSAGLPAAPGSWPWATLIVNVVGAALLGVVIATRWSPRTERHLPPLLGTGLCGGLTTFSTFQWELLEMIDAHRFAPAAGYAAASLAAGLLAVHAGTRAVRRGRVAP